jgi:hypothetical protein
MQATETGQGCDQRETARGMVGGDIAPIDARISGGLPAGPGSSGKLQGMPGLY